jgi:hypothetical protein
MLARRLQLQFFRVGNLRLSARRLVWSAMFLSLGLISFPIPVPVLRLSEPDEIPYPCQGGHCGCSSAHQCWTSCCCMSLEQRLEWARSRGIEPPVYAKKIQNAKGAGQTVSQTASKDSKPERSKRDCSRQCCRKEDQTLAEKSDLSTDSGSKPSCCRGNSQRQSSKSEPGSVPSKVQLITSIRALECQGLFMDLAIHMGFIPLERCVKLEHSPGLTWTIPFLNCVARPVSLQPPIPPPRSFE